MLGSASAMRMVAEKSGMAMDSIPLSSMQMAMTVIATGPIILLYPFTAPIVKPLTKYFCINDKLFTLQYYLQRMLGSASAMRMVAEKSGMAMDSIPLSSMKMAMTVIATGPIILLYPFIQKYFVKGLTIGAVKG